MNYSGDFKLDVFDTYSYLMIAPFSIVASFILIIAQLASKQLRQAPGDLILMISTSELFLSIHYLISAVRTTYVTEGYKEEGAFCSFNSFIHTFFRMTEFLYNVCFLSHIYFTMKSAIQKSFVPKKLYHVFCLLVAGGITYAYYVEKKFGRSPYGTCSVKVGVIENGKRINVFKDLIVGIVEVVAGSCLGVFILLYTNKNLPNFGAELNNLRRDFINYYRSYIQACILIWSVMFGSLLCQVFGEDQRMQLEENQNLYGTLFTIGRIGNTAQLIMPLVLFFIRVQDPLIRKNIWLPFTRCFKKLSKPGSEIQTPLEDRQARRLTIPLTIDGRVEDITLEMVNDTEDLMWMNLLPAKIKESYTRTFLASIYLYYADKLDEKKGIVTQSQVETEDLCWFPVKGKAVMKALETERSIIDCKFSIYSPAVFREIIDSSFKKIDVRRSLDIALNEEKIKKAGESGGGASGELFLFSHDSQLILKTASNEECRVFKTILQDYKQHLKVHQGTQITKIYGMFDFAFGNSDKSIKLILMENLFTMNSESVLRKYDVKGSRFSRQVLKNYKEIDAGSKVEKILKDLDFEEIDKQIKLEPEKRAELIKYIEGDVNFFKSHGLIDYSLIIAVVAYYNQGGQEDNRHRIPRTRAAKPQPSHPALGCRPGHALFHRNHRLLPEIRLQEIDGKILQTS
jgi:hypothetical protein